MNFWFSKDFNTFRDINIGDEVDVIGMGVQNEYDATTSDYLMHATLSVMTNDHCNSLLDKKILESEELKNDLNVGFLQDMICAGYVDGGRDACQVWFEPMIIY